MPCWARTKAQCDNIIGSANYESGTFSTGGGGVAYLNSPCNNNLKAGGVTVQSMPVGDGFDIDYVAHEMGHQYSANHTEQLLWRVLLRWRWVVDKPSWAMPASAHPMSLCIGIAMFGGLTCRNGRERHIRNEQQLPRQCRWCGSCAPQPMRASIVSFEVGIIHPHWQR